MSVLSHIRPERGAHAHPPEMAVVYDAGTQPGRACHTALLARGVATRGDDWPLPLMPGLEAAGVKTVVDTRPNVQSGAYHPERCIQAMTDEVVRRLGQGAVTLVGVSMGGNIAAIVTSRVRELNLNVDVDDRLRLIMLDSPAGVETFAQVPDNDLARLAFRRAVIPAVKQLPPVLDSVAMSHAHLLPGIVPRQITIPEASLRERIIGRSCSEAEWCECVRQATCDQFDNNSAAQLFRQLGWMGDIYENGRLPNALQSLGSHACMSYVAYKGEKNTIVRQPLAMQRHLQANSSIATYEIEGVQHVGFWEDAVAINRAIGWALRAE